MKLLAGNGEQVTPNIVVRESIAQYYSILEASFLNKLPQENLVIEDAQGNQADVVAVRGELDTETRMYTYTLMNTKVRDMFNKIYPSFEGTCTLKQLLQKLSIPHEIDMDTAPLYWRIVSGKLSSLIRQLTDLTTVPQGGAPKFYVNLYGKLKLVDLKQVLSSTEHIPLRGDVISDSISLDSKLIIDNASAELHVFTSDGMSKENVTLVDNLGTTVITINDTTGKESALVKRTFINRFNINYYTSRTVQVSNVIGNAEVGDLVTLNDNPTKFVVTTKKTSIPSEQENYPPFIVMSLCRHESD